MVPDWSLRNWNRNVLCKQILSWSNFYVWPKRNTDIYLKCIYSGLDKRLTKFNHTHTSILSGERVSSSDKKSLASKSLLLWYSSSYCLESASICNNRKQMAKSMTLIQSQTEQGNYIVRLSHSCYFIANNLSWTCNNRPNYHLTNRKSINSVHSPTCNRL